MPRWPLTLWRSLVVELARLVLLSTGVLVAVIAFGASVKPISDGVLEPAAALKYITLAIPPMLAYALPFASGLAATLVYHRAAQDNEVIAAQAGGLSHRSVLAPALFVAIVLTGGLVVLNESVIPRFLRSMAELINLDMPKFMAQQIAKGNAVKVGNSILYADAALKTGPDPGSGATDRLVLSRLAALETRDSEITTILTARRADLWFFPPGFASDDSGRRPGAGGQGGADALEPGDQSQVFMRLHSALYDRKGEATAGLRDVAEAAFAVPLFWLDKPSYMTFAELRALRKRPEAVNWIDQRRRKLAYELAQRQTLSDMKQTVEQKRELRLIDDRGRDVVIRASGMEWDGERWLLRPLAAGGEVEVRLAGAPGSAAEPSFATASPAVLMYARTASPRIELVPDRTTSRLAVRLSLERVRTMLEGTDPASGGGTERATQTLTGLGVATTHEDTYLSLPALDLLEAARRAELGVGPDTVAAAADDLALWNGRLQRDVTAKQHERMALAATCFIAILTGALTALKLSQKLPLTVYLWTFFPALACWISISSGQQMVRQAGDYGLLLMWAGVALLAIYASMVYNRLPPPGQRHTFRHHHERSGAVAAT